MAPTPDLQARAVDTVLEQARRLASTST